MGTHLLNKLEAWSLIVGPPLALIFFMVEPGGMLIDSAEASDPLGKISAYVANTSMSHITGLVDSARIAIDALRNIRHQPRDRRSSDT